MFSQESAKSKGQGNGPLRWTCVACLARRLRDRKTWMAVTSLAMTED
jgi:hypothetical protein